MTNTKPSAPASTKPSAPAGTERSDPAGTERSDPAGTERSDPAGTEQSARDSLIPAARAGNRRAIGRLVSIVERGGPPADGLAAVAHQAGGRAHIVGITGAPGAGKSTLVGALVHALAHAGRRIAVLAIDPSSPLTGGAILGDRIRMDDAVASAPGQVFIRSMATRGRLGGLAAAVPAAIAVLDAAGFDQIVVETAGVGQAEVDIAANADTTVVVLNPGWGDAIQANKAGLLEMADVFVVNKADRPGVDDAVRDVEYMLDLGHKGIDSWRAPIVRTIATDAVGVAEVIAAIDRHRIELESSDELARRRAARFALEVRAQVRAAADARIGKALSAETHLLDQVSARVVSPTHAAQIIIEKLLD